MSHEAALSAANAPWEGTITCGARADAVVQKLLLARQTQILGRGTGGEDHRLKLPRGLVACNHERMTNIDACNLSARHNPRSTECERETHEAADGRDTGDITVSETVRVPNSSACF